MGKLYFNYSVMNAGKSTALLQADFNYKERGMNTYRLTAKLDHRSGTGRISSRVGVSADADTFAPEDDLYERLRVKSSQSELACIFVDEAQFLSKEQVWQLACAVDDFNLPIMCYGLRNDFQGNAFPGSAALLMWADEMREVRTICSCGKKAAMIIRQDSNGLAVREGQQVLVGGEEVYVSLCRRHWRAKMDEAAAVSPEALEAICDQELGPSAPCSPCVGAESPQ